jgi:O-antigen/teichoic acid export membrane protein
MHAAESDAKLTLSRLVARNTIIQLGGRALTLVIALASLMVLTRYLGVEGIGQYLLVISFLGLLNFSDLGLLLITVRELSAGKEDQDVLVGNVLVMRVVSALFSMVLAATVAIALDYPDEVTAAIIVGSVSYLFVAVGSGSLGAVFIANLRMEFQVLANVVQYVTFLVLVSAVVYFELGLIPLVIAYNISMLASCITIVITSRRFVSPRLQMDAALWRRIIFASLPAGVNTIAWVLYSRIDMVMLSQMQGDEAVGLYGLAYRFVDLAWPLGFFFVGSVYPLLSRHFKSSENDEFRWLLQRATDVIALLALGPITIMVVFAEPILTIVASDEFVPATTTLQILAVAIFPLWMGMLSSYTVLALEKQWWLIVIGLVALAINVGANLILIPAYSYEGAAVTTLLTEVSALSMLLFTIRSRLGYLPSFQTSARMTPVLAASTAAALLLVPDSIPAQVAIVLPGIIIAYVFSRAISISSIRAILGRTDQLEKPETGAYAPSEIGAGR